MILFGLAITQPRNEKVFATERIQRIVNRIQNERWHWKHEKGHLLSLQTTPHRKK